MKITIALCLLFVSATLSAQYGPPAKDLEEGLFFLKEIQRQLEPAVNEARERAVVFKLVANVQTRLIGRDPGTEISDAIRSIDDFFYRRRQSARTLSPENLKTLESVRKELELQQPPYTIVALRERLHHEFVHPLQMKVLTDMRDIERLKSEWENFVGRHLRPTYDEGLAGITVATKEPGQ
jgi:hypothetical protein